MTSVPDILASIRNDDVDPDLLWRVSELLTRWRTEESGGRLEGFGPEVMEVELDRADIDALRLALLGLVEPDLSHPQASTIVWLLGKWASPEDQPLFRRALERGVEEGDDLLYQALIALDNLGVLNADTTSFSAFEVETNRALAQAYLASEPSTPGS